MKKMYVFVRLNDMFKKIPRNLPKNATGLLLFLLRECFIQDSKAPEEGLDIMVATVRIVATNPVIAFTLRTFKTFSPVFHKTFVLWAASVEKAPISRATNPVLEYPFFLLRCLSSTLKFSAWSCSMDTQPSRAAFKASHGFVTCKSSWKA